MRKKSLEQIPLPAYPKEFPPKQVMADRKHVVTARKVEADGEELLEITGFQAGSGDPAWRTFIDVAGEKFLTQHLTGEPRWSRKVVHSLLYGTGAYSQYGISPHDYLIPKKDSNAIRLLLKSSGYSNPGNPLDDVSSFQRSIGAARKARQKARIDGIFSYVESILPPLPDDLDQFIQDICMPGSRYLFYSKKNRHSFRTGWCTSCQIEIEMLDFDVKHKLVDTCPNCCSDVQYRAEGLSRTKLIDRAAFSITQPGKEPYELITRYFEVERNYSGDPRHVRNNLMETARFYMNLQTRQAYQWRQNWNYWWFGWSERDDTLHPSGFTHAQYLDPPPFQRCGPTIHHYPLKAIKRSSFAHCGYDLYCRHLKKCKTYFHEVDPATYLACYARYPCIEYLLKMGFFRLSQELLRGDRKLLNPRGQSPEEVFRLPMQDIRLLRKYDPDAGTLQLYRLLQKQGKQIARPDLEYLAANRIGIDRMEYLGRYLSPARITGYLKKQVEVIAEGGQQRSPSDICRDWVDYLKDLTGRLRQPITSENLRPASLYEAHTRILAQIEDRDNPELNKDIRKLAKQYNRKYAFSAGGLSIRAAWSCGELIAEGKSLGHCVGRYGSYVAQKTCAIMLIRRDETPDAPFFTLEINWRDKKHQEPYVAQCRGVKNCEPSQEVKAFVELWEQEKLLPKQKNENVEIRVPVAIAG